MRRTPVEGAQVAQQGDVATTENASLEHRNDAGDPLARVETPAIDAPPADTRTPEPGPRSDARPLHWIRGPLVTLLGGLVPFCTMAYEDRWRLSVPIGFLGCAIATWGILDWLGTFDDPDESVVARTKLRSLVRPLVELVASAVATIVALTIAVAGALPAPRATAAVLVPATFLWCVAAVFKTARALGGWASPTGEATPIGKRYGFWLVVIVTVLYLPLLGSYSLSDPWETHYGEVAREMLARDDWISTWWAQDGWFWSKPVFDFWVQALAFSLLGVRYMPDEMLRSAERGHFPSPEWAARMPIFIVTLIGAYLLYRAVARVWGQRVGLLAGVVLTTMPYWYLIAHQTMTDMPYVGTLTAGMALLLCGFLTDPDKTTPVYEVTAGRRAIRVSAFHLLFAAIILCTLPQILYLATRNVTLHLSADLLGFRPHADEFFFGSGGGNCGLPGNGGCRPEKPVNSAFWPIHGALLWSGVLGLVLWTNRNERRSQRLYFIGGWLFVALAAMAKGAPGLVLPLASVGAFVFVTRRWRDAERLELPTFVLIVACVTLPWYVQMFARHGSPFIDRLIMHDMYKRAFVHVHDTNQGDDVSFRYYVWQLGYGLFPWTGLSAVGLLWWRRRDERRGDARNEAATLLILWFFAAFGMFTITLTKFHHYIFPLVPPVAVFTALVVDYALGRASPAKPRRFAAYLTAVTTGLLLLLYGTMRLFPRRFDGTALAGDPPWLGWGVLCAVAGLALVAGAAIAWHNRDPEAAPLEGGVEQDDPLHEKAVLAIAALASASAVLLAGRDLITSLPTDVEGQMRIVQLFTYNYRRPWPESLDFTGALVAFTAVAAVLSLLIAWKRVRAHATILFCVTAVLWAAWGVNVYLYKVSPHWGQRETIMEYYEQRASPAEPIVAYQMNWKGENFYTGNRIPAFVSSGTKFKDWVAEQKKNGVSVMFFTTEHGRIGSLKRELGTVKSFEKLTDEALNNKFFLARVEL